MCDHIPIDKTATNETYLFLRSEKNQLIIVIQKQSLDLHSADWVGVLTCRRSMQRKYIDLVKNVSLLTGSNVLGLHSTASRVETKHSSKHLRTQQKSVSRIIELTRPHET